MCSLPTAALHISNSLLYSKKMKENCNCTILAIHLNQINSLKTVPRYKYHNQLQSHTMMLQQTISNHVPLIWIGHTPCQGTQRYSFLEYQVCGAVKFLHDRSSKTRYHPFDCIRTKVSDSGNIYKPLKQIQLNTKSETSATLSLSGITMPTPPQSQINSNLTTQ